MPSVRHQGVTIRALRSQWSHDFMKPVKNVKERRAYQFWSLFHYSCYLSASNWGSLTYYNPQHGKTWARKVTANRKDWYIFMAQLHVNNNNFSLYFRAPSSHPSCPHQWFTPPNHLYFPLMLKLYLSTLICYQNNFTGRWLMSTLDAMFLLTFSLNKSFLLFKSLSFRKKVFFTWKLK